MFPEMKTMQLPDKLIPNLLERELTGICTTCIHFNDCLYRCLSEKIIIQCEFHQRDLKTKPRATSLVGIQKANKKNNVQGLCFTCSHAAGCELPKENGGVWRCTDYK
jgi:hypothetical protein